MFVGCSTGGIVALANTSTITFTTEQLINFYLGEEGKTIFKGKLIKFPWETVKYPDKDIESVLSSKFKNEKFGSCIKPCVVTAYDMYTRTVTFFNSTQDKYKDLLVKDIARATSAAPTFFSPCRISENVYIDGGMANNDVSLCAYVEAKKMFPNDEIILIRVGTGSAQTSYDYKTLKKWNLLDWAKNLFAIFTDGQSDTAQYMCRKILPENNYYSFDVLLPEDMDKIDDTSEKYLNNLINLFKKYFNYIWVDDFNNLVDELKNKKY